MKNLLFLAFALLFFANNSQAQKLVYGKTYKIENLWMNKGVYLDVNGAGCQDNYLCVSTTRDARRKNSNTSDWIILSATGKKAGEAVQNGDLILLKNPWMRTSYLGTRGYSKDFGCPGFLCVSAYGAVDNVKSTTWKITGNIATGTEIRLQGQWNNAAAGYLDINGHHEAGGYNVCTATDGRIKQSTSAWKFLPQAKEEAKVVSCEGKEFKVDGAKKIYEKINGKWLHVGDRCVELTCNRRRIFCKSTDGSLWRYNGQPHNWTPANTLLAGQNLNAGTIMGGAHFLASANGTHFFYMQENGDLGIWSHTPNPKNIWYQRPSNLKNCTLEMQTDGNLVVYSAAKKALWSSETQEYWDKRYNTAKYKPVRLVLENDGTIVLYSATNYKVWDNKKGKYPLN